MECGISLVWLTVWECTYRFIHQLFDIHSDVFLAFPFGKCSGILSGIHSDILTDILPVVCCGGPHGPHFQVGIYLGKRGTPSVTLLSDMFPDILSDTCSCNLYALTFRIFFRIHFEIHTQTRFCIFSGIGFGFGALSGMCLDILFDTLPDTCCGDLFEKHSDIQRGVLPGTILAYYQRYFPAFCLTHVLATNCKNNFWHSTWHSMWQKFGHATAHIFDIGLDRSSEILYSIRLILAIFLESFWHMGSHYVWHVVRHTFWHNCVANILGRCVVFVLALPLAFFLLYLLDFLWKAVWERWRPALM